MVLLAAGCSASGASLGVAQPAAARAGKTVTTAAYELHYRQTGKPQPLVLVLGASGESLPGIVAAEGQNELADQDGFAVAYVPAPDAQHIWYTGPDSSDVPKFDGVAYLSQQIVDIAGRTPIDLSHVFVEGWSNGGFMAVHAVTTAPDTFAAAGEIESVLDLPVTTTQPVRIIHIQSVLDQVVPIGGGDSRLLHAEFGRAVNLPSTYSEGKLLPIGSTWTLITDEGTGPGHHGYQPFAAQKFWNFFAATLAGS